ncbi:MAG: sigma 54-interacting transcriptional regulator [Desulfobacter sp.]|nr:MAG: sigma 54-interacting transcriptional regulator [Desulfobacter sp.]
MEDRAIFAGLEKRILELEKIAMEDQGKIHALEEANRILEGVLNGIPDVIGIQNPDQTMIRYNRAGYDALGKTEKEIVGMPCYSLIGRTAPCKDCATLLALKSKKIETVERFIPELGRHLICRSNPILDASGGVTHIVEQIRDITERKLLEKEKDDLIGQLKAAVEKLTSRALYKMLADIIQEGVIVGYDHEIVYANPAALHILKMETETLYRMGPGDIIHGDHKKTYRRIVERLEKGAGHEDMEICCRDGRGSRIWTEARFRPVELKKKKGLLITLRDITLQREKRRLERKKALRLKKENRLLHSRHMHPYGLAHLVGTSERMQRVYEKMIGAVPIDENVIIYGESGTGKELVARSIHDLSERKKGPFITVNCGAIPENLAESEFFGHEKGAFTGAEMAKIGLFQSAHKGTLFLDEIGEIPLKLQVKLLRVIEGYGFTPVGGTGSKQADVRIIAATNRDLKTMVAAGKIREDFYYRIHIIPIHLPPLRERKEDIPLLVYHFTRKMDMPEHRRRIPDEAIEKFMTHEWPGNIRELQNTISRYLAFDQVEFAGTTAVPGAGNDTAAGETNLNAMLNAYERRIITTELSRTQGNKSQAAKALGIDRRSLHRKISRLGL